MAMVRNHPVTSSISPFRQNVQAGSGANIASSTFGNGGYFSESKAAEAGS
jgi:hypothetical protein